MTTATVKINKSDLMAPPVAQTMQKGSLVIGVVGTVAAVAGAFLSASFYSAYLTGTCSGSAFRWGAWPF